MDPMTALNVAAAVVQFVDFSVRVCRDTQVLLDSNEIPSLSHLSQITQGLDDYKALLHDRAPKCSPGSALSSNDAVSIHPIGQTTRPHERPGD